VTCTDAHTVRDLAGKTSDCAPYLCQASACKTACASVDDCVPPFVCDRGGRCVPIPQGGGDDGCSASGSARNSLAAWLATGGVLFALALRRKRQRSR
jgi:hypothetical protein